MSMILGIVGIVTGGLALLIGAWQRRGPSTSRLVARRIMPDEVLPDGSTRKGDVIELRGW